MNHVSERSKRLIAPAIAFEQRAAKAFKSKSLSELENLYADIALLQEDPIEMETAGVDACGCDVALINLSVIVGFAMNKLNGQGLYESWMLDQSLELLAEYREVLSDCVSVAAEAAAPELLTAQLLKAL